MKLFAVLALVSMMAGVTFSDPTPGEIYAREQARDILAARQIRQVLEARAVSLFQC